MPANREDLIRLAREAAESAWEEGCPVASAADRIAPIAVRRWLSSNRRGVAEDQLDHRIKDLAKGLIERFQREPRLVGRLKVDYEYLAGRIAEALSE